MDANTHMNFENGPTSFHNDDLTKSKNPIQRNGIETILNKKKLSSMPHPFNT